MLDLIRELCDAADWRLSVGPTGATIDTGTRVYIGSLTPDATDSKGRRYISPAVQDRAAVILFTSALRSEVRDQ